VSDILTTMNAKATSWSSPLSCYSGTLTRTSLANAGAACGGNLGRLGQDGWTAVHGPDDLRGVQPLPDDARGEHSRLPGLIGA